MIQRKRLLEELALRIAESPVTVLLGARQVGKTTLARLFCGGRKEVAWFDLETAAGLESLRALPEKTLGGKRGLVVLDEVQRMPEMFRLLRPLCDREGAPARFLFLGSASPELVRGVSESLAGRAQFLQVPGLTVAEVGWENQDRLWMRGGFPAAYLARDAVAAGRWQEGFVQTFLERDIPQLGIRVPAAALRRFWAMAAHYHGQVLNLADLGRALGVAPGTARHYLDILCGAYVLRQLPPWFENLGKRQVKSPKLYFRDSGLLHYFLGAQDMDALLAHPRLGASWEGVALEQVLAQVGERD
ncbi:MAG: ATP-binding protein, partial [Kiritimatiellae bacterium]|nr:ATP-binding protein [Kiritimatiellia bacterium]